jgi:hypothetical protein
MRLIIRRASSFAAACLLGFGCSRSTPPAPPPAPAPEVVDPVESCLDKVTTDAHLNAFGDPPGTVYAGGTPLFDEATGHSTPRLEYLRRRHPELAAKCSKSP